jgi:hypothetical protein
MPRARECRLALGIESQAGFKKGAQSCRQFDISHPHCERWHSSSSQLLVNTLLRAKTLHRTDYSTISSAAVISTDSQQCTIV